MNLFRIDDNNDDGGGGGGGGGGDDDDDDDDDEDGGNGQSLFFHNRESFDFILVYLNITFVFSCASYFHSRETSLQK